MYVMDIKYNIGNEVYLYDNKRIVKTKITKVVIEEDKVKYSVLGTYHHMLEENLFPTINLLLEDLKKNVVTAKPINMKNKLNNLFKKKEQ